VCTTAWSCGRNIRSGWGGRPGGGGGGGGGGRGWGGDRIPLLG
jgi:hypothetical protein